MPLPPRGWELCSPTGCTARISGARCRTWEASPGGPGSGADIKGASATPARGPLFISPGDLASSVRGPGQQNGEDEGRLLPLPPLPPLFFVSPWRFKSTLLNSVLEKESTKREERRAQCGARKRKMRRERDQKDRRIHAHVPPAAVFSAPWTPFERRCGSDSP